MQQAGYEFKKFGNKFLIRINKGEEIVSTLKTFCIKNNVKLGTIQGIGAINSATFGFFNPETKHYQEKTIDKPMEITSLTGNITTKDNETYLHIHMNAAGNDYNTAGGHLVTAVVSLTAEIAIEEFSGIVERTFCEKTGLNLMDFNKA